MSVDLGLEFAGIRFKNPFLISPSPLSNPRVGPYERMNFKKAAKAGWSGGIIRLGIPTTSYFDVEGYAHNMFLPREIKYIDVRQKPPAFYGIFNICLVQENMTKDVVPIGTEEVIRAAKKEVREFGDWPIGFDVGAMEDPEPWVKIARAAEEAGADFITLNLSCPTTSEFGIWIGVEPELITKITKAVKKEVSVPVIPKLTPNVPHHWLVKTAKAAEEGGADGLVCGNTILGFIGVDIETGIPIGSYVDVNGKLRGAVSGYGGPILRPINMRMVAQVANSVKVPISACGGISDWDHAVEYIMLGASNVQVCSAGMVYGYKVVKGWIKGLEDFMKRKGYETIEDFKGITTEKYLAGATWTNPIYPQPFEMEVDEDLCTGCSVCVPACDASAAGAIKVVDLKVTIDKEKCIQCNMCKNVCPEGAISRVYTA
jgi:dihydropyrimidine dehydrogenase (NAD+) subunit PreA